jgi:hypothetical protein
MIALSVYTPPRIMFARSVTRLERTLPRLRLASDMIFCSQDILFATARPSTLLAIQVVANHAKDMSAVLVAANCTTSRIAPLYRINVQPMTVAIIPDVGLHVRLGQMNAGSACPIPP